MRIESTAADRGFGLQTGCAVMLFSYGDADKREVLSGSRSGEEVALAEELSFFDSSIRRTRAVEECPAPPPTRSSLLQMALQSESLISGLEIARPFCHWVYP